MHNNVNIRQAESPGDLDEIRKLFREYESWLGIDLCFQGFEDELASLPGKYAAPGGRLYLAAGDDSVAGCVALRPFDEKTGEIKRLFLRENARGLGLGKLLIEKVIADARAIGYRRIVLDTLYPRMAKAVELYKAHGFRAIDPYYHNPNEEALFMELRLD